MQSEQPVVPENNAAAASQPGKEPVVPAESVEAEVDDGLEKAFLKKNLKKILLLILSTVYCTSSKRLSQMINGKMLKDLQSTVRIIH